MRARWCRALMLVGSVIGILLGRAADASTLRVVVSSSVQTYGHPFVRSGPAAIRFSIFDTLTREASDGRLEPCLALSWRLEAPTIWRFELRPDVVFSNGKPFSAQTVVETVNILKSDQAKTFDLAVEVASVSHVEVVDTYTVRIHTTVADPILPARFALIRIVEPDAWRELGVAGYSKDPVGTGPYRVTDWGSNTGLTIMEGVATSWRKPIEMTRVEVRYAPDAISRMQALLSKQVDLAFTVSPDDISLLKEGGATPHVFPGPMVISLSLRNFSDANRALRDKRVRQALNYAVDRAKISTEIMAGTMPVARTGFTAATVGGDLDVTPYVYDPARARDLLTQAGYGNGLKLVAGVTVGQVPNDALAFEAVAQDLRKVGVDLQIRQLSFPDFVDRAISGRWNGLDMVSLLWGAGTYADAYRYLNLHSCENTSRYFCDPDASALLTDIKIATDPSARSLALKRAVARYHDLAPAIWLVEYASIAGSSARLQGVDIAFIGIYFERMTFATNTD